LRVLGGKEGHSPLIYLGKEGRPRKKKEKALAEEGKRGGGEGTLLSFKINRVTSDFLFEVDCSSVQKGNVAEERYLEGEALSPDKGREITVATP